MRRVLILLAMTLAVRSLLAADVDYGRDIKPLLMEKCSACHGALKQEAGLRLDAAVEQLLAVGELKSAIRERAHYLNPPPAALPSNSKWK